MLVELVRTFFNANCTNSHSIRDHPSCNVLPMFCRAKFGLLAIVLCTAIAPPVSADPALPVIPNQTFVITSYGAIGDGVTTNTTAIQSTINAASTNGGGTVEIPAGTFVCG